jgi:HTH-type transcriptional regulator, glycine betaine synthesis regulator
MFTWGEVRAPSQSAEAIEVRSQLKDEFSTECRAFFGEVVQLFGISPSVGQIYGLLYASNEPLSFSDIFEKLDISKGSASQGLNLLRSLGAVHTVSTVDTGGRREYFAPELSLRKLVRGVLDERVGPLASKSADRFARLLELVNESEGSVKKFRFGRVQQLEIWRRRMKTLMPVLSTLFGAKA